MDTCAYLIAVELARFAALSQEADLVPAIEPEVPMDGDHTIEHSYELTSDPEASPATLGAASRARATMMASTP